MYGRTVKQHTKDITSPLRFQGQYFDQETGLHYNRHRYYNPKNGLFTTADPIGLAGGLNNYQYVKNPTGWVDPLGLAQNKGNCICESSKQEQVNTISQAIDEVELPSLNWDSVVPKKGRYKGQTRMEHVRLHNIDNPSKPNHGVFYGDGVDITNQAWFKASELNIEPDANGNLFVPMNKLTGRAGGQAVDSGELFYGVHIKLVPGTNKLITSFPGN